MPTPDCPEPRREAPPVLDPSSMLSTAALDRRAVDREREDLRETAALTLILQDARLPLSDGRLVLVERSRLGDPSQDPARPEVYLGEIPAEALPETERHAAIAAAGSQGGIGVTVRSLSEAELSDTEVAAAVGPADWVDLRRAATALMGAAPADEALAVAAQAVTVWHREHPRCPRCGELTRVERSGWLRVCPQDGSLHFPRTDPAIIVTVTDGEPGTDQERVLLGRAAAWPQRRFSTLAGFVEPGESFEQAVVREIEEEAGVIVGEVRCLGSQPWPFPRSLMIGCTARLQEGEAIADGQEVAEVRWFTRAQLREAARSGEIALPGRISIARSLIEHWNGEPLTDSDW